MKKTVTYQDFPVTRETDQLRIWKGLDINQKGKINIGKNEQIYESRLYPFKEGKDKLKVLSKINKITKEITFVISSNRILLDPQTTDIKKYQDLVANLEDTMKNNIIIDENNFLTGKQIQNQMK